MKKLFTRVAVITAGILLPTIAFATVFSQNQVFPGPYGGGFLFSTSTTAFDKLTATSSPTAGWYTATSTTQASLFPYASTTALSISGLTSGNCVQASTGGLLVTTGSACGAGGGSSYPFTTLTTYATTTSATTSPLYSAGGFFASTTSSIPSLAITQAGTGAVATFMGGNVGIGSTSPENKLVVSGAGTTRLVIADTTGTAYARFSATGNDAFFSNSGTGSTFIGSAGSNPLSVNSNGNVGIATTTGQAPLSVSIGATNDFLDLGRTGNADWFVGNASGNLVFGPGTIGTTANRIFNFTTSGSLGLASTTPWARASVDTTGCTTATPPFAIGSTTKTNFVVNCNGNVSIGSTNNAFGLDVAGNAFFRNNLLVATSLSSAAAANLTFLSNNNTKTGITITSGIGNIGIGTTTPGFYQTQIATSTVPQIGLSDGSLTSDHSYIRSISGNTYIGTSSPSTYATSTIPAIFINDADASTTIQRLTVGAAATSTFNGGINITAGCFSKNNACIGASSGSTVTSYRQENFNVASSTVQVPVSTGDTLNIWSYSNSACAANSETNSIDLFSPAAGATSTKATITTTIARGCYAGTNYVYTATANETVVVEGYSNHVTTATTSIMVMKTH